MEDRPPDSPEPSPPPSYVYDAPSEPPPAGPGVIPWEEPGRPWLSGLVETIKLLFTSPRAAFERVPLETSLLRPYSFALLLGLVGLYGEVAFLIMNLGASRAMLPPGAPDPFATIPPMLLPAFFVCLPLFVVLPGIIINTAVLHVALLIVGGAQKGFGATFRTSCYSYAGALLLAIPFCGGLIGGVAQLVLLAIGLSTVHRIGIGRAIAAVALPVAACCACILAFMLFAMTMAGAKHP